ncbi:MAG TPA: LamG-like jellyroll fold domain-containing protein [Candidatus Baltobacteraceae bacterium]|jgi:hypothetical protein|nr:LamG-like jellyroll fold domain-containing protein [Candidatus Baltobacteraceae bacterium]
MKTRQSWKIASASAAAMLLGALATLPVRAQTYPTQIEALMPLDYWRLNEKALPLAPDIISNLGSAGAAGNGYALSGALTGQPGGIVGNAVQLLNPTDDLDDCYTRIDIPNLAVLNPAPPFTIEFWAKPTSLSSDSTGLCVLSSDSPFPGDTSRSGYLFYLKAGPGGWTFRLGGENSYTATAAQPGTATQGAWSHIVGEYDGTNASLYVNGVLAASGSSSLSSPFHANDWVPTRIGGTALYGAEYADGNGNSAYGTGNRGYDGYLDELAIYTNLLSASTIMAHYTAGTGNTNGYDALILASSPVGYWNMDEPAYTAPATNTYPFAADIGTLGDNGTNTLGAETDQPGVPGLSTDAASVYYSGSLGSLVLDTNVAQPSFSGQPITLAAWIKPNSFGYVEDIIAQGYDPVSYAENFLRVGDSFDWESYSFDDSGGDNNTNVLPDVVYYSIGTYDGSSPAYNTAVFPAPAGDIGHWVFLVGTYDGAEWNLYRNGTLVGQFADDGVGPSALADPWSVGSRSGPNEYFGMYFDGLIEEATIFTNALDPGTISNLYNAVALPPVITQAPVAPSPAYLGSSASLSVWADGTPPLSYQWTENGQAIAGQTGTNLSLTGLTAATSGTYAVIVKSSFGSVTSSVVLLVTPTLPPAELLPVVETRWFDFPFSFAPATLPNQQLFFQWYTNGSPIPGATDSSFSGIATSNYAGSYTLVLTNSFGSATSSVSALVIRPWPAGYASTILSNSPVAYFRLDETNGTVAYDYAGGNDGNYYGANLLFGQPGFSFIDSDLAVTFPGFTNNYVGDIGAATLNFPGTAAEFTIEAWANGGPNQIDGAAIVAKGEGDNGGIANEQFALAVNGANYRFFVRDPTADHTIAEADANIGPDGAWHHLVGVCDGAGGTVNIYIDGALAGTTGTPAAGVTPSPSAVSIGAERSGVLPPYDWPYSGTIDEVAIYNKALTPAEVETHYAAAYGPDLAPFVKLQPVSVTNYINLPVSFEVSAAGTVPVSYQWNKVGSGPIPGATDTLYSIPNLTLGDAGSYTCGITNSVGGILSTTVTVTVLPAPTNPPAIADLVMHLTFDGTMLDATGRGNNATNLASGGATVNNDPYVPGILGEAFGYQTTVTSATTNANYATVGYRPDLQFGSNSFTVSMWVQLPVDYIGDDLPFFTDVPGSTFGYPGYCFEPSFGTTEGTTTGWPGGWGFSVYGQTDVGEGVYGDVGTINDGNWHNLIYVIDRNAGATIYLDGVPAHQNVQAGTSVVGIGNINSTNIATIGQDPTGLYPQSSEGLMAIDDLGVWTRALTPLEAASIFTAANVNQLSFTSPATITLSFAVLPGAELQLTWSQGNLQSATNLLGPWSTVQGATSPFTTNELGPQQFFRAQQ